MKKCILSLCAMITLIQITMHAQDFPLIKTPKIQITFHEAIRAGLPKAVQSMIKKGKKVNAPITQFGDTPLHLAVATNHPNIVEILIKNNANVETKNGDFMTPLHLAAQRGLVKPLKVLLQNKANVNAKDNYGATPLYSVESIEIAELLLTNGANVNEVTNDNNTPLHSASLDGGVPMIKFLLDKGSSINAKNKSGETPLHWATEKNSNGGGENVQFLLKKGANVNAKDKKGDTPLHWAAREYGGPQAVALLIKHDAQVNAVNRKGKTPLDLVINRKGTFLDPVDPKSSQEIIKILREAGGKKGKEIKASPS